LRRTSIPGHPPIPRKKRNGPRKKCAFGQREPSRRQEAVAFEPEFTPEEKRVPKANK